MGQSGVIQYEELPPQGGATRYPITFVLDDGTLEQILVRYGTSPRKMKLDLQLLGDHVQAVLIPRVKTFAAQNTNPPLRSELRQLADEVLRLSGIREEIIRPADKLRWVGKVLGSIIDIRPFRSELRGLGLENQQMSRRTFFARSGQEVARAAVAGRTAPSVVPALLKKFAFRFSVASFMCVGCEIVQVVPVEGAREVNTTFIERAYRGAEAFFSQDVGFLNRRLTNDVNLQRRQPYADYVTPTEIGLLLIQLSQYAAKTKTSPDYSVQKAFEKLREELGILKQYQKDYGYKGLFSWPEIGEDGTYAPSGKKRRVFTSEGNKVSFDDNANLTLALLIVSGLLRGTDVGNMALQMVKNQQEGYEALVNHERGLFYGALILNRNIDSAQATEAEVHPDTFDIGDINRETAGAIPVLIAFFNLPHELWLNLITEDRINVGSFTGLDGKQSSFLKGKELTEKSRGGDQAFTTFLYSIFALNDRLSSKFLRDNLYATINAVLGWAVQDEKKGNPLEGAPIPLGLPAPTTIPGGNRPDGYGSFGIPDEAFFSGLPEGERPSADVRTIYPILLIYPLLSGVQRELADQMIEKWDKDVNYISYAQFQILRNSVSTEGRPSNTMLALDLGLAALGSGRYEFMGGLEEILQSQGVLGIVQSLNSKADERLIPLFRNRSELRAKRLLEPTLVLLKPTGKREALSTSIELIVRTLQQRIIKSTKHGVRTIVEFQWLNKNNEFVTSGADQAGQLVVEKIRLIVGKGHKRRKQSELFATRVLTKELSQLVLEASGGRNLNEKDIRIVIESEGAWPENVKIRAIPRETKVVQAKQKGRNISIQLTKSGNGGFALLVSGEKEQRVFPAIDIGDRATALLAEARATKLSEEGKTAKAIREEVMNLIAKQAKEITPHFIGPRAELRAVTQPEQKKVPQPAKLEAKKLELTPEKLDLLQYATEKLIGISELHLIGSDVAYAEVLNQLDLSPVREEVVTIDQIRRILGDVVRILSGQSNVAARVVEVLNPEDLKADLFRLALLDAALNPNLNLNYIVPITKMEDYSTTVSKKEAFKGALWSELNKIRRSLGKSPAKSSQIVVNVAEERFLTRDINRLLPGKGSPLQKHTVVVSKEERVLGSIHSLHAARVLNDVGVEAAKIHALRNEVAKIALGKRQANFEHVMNGSSLIGAMLEQVKDWLHTIAVAA